jgi:hypothetical protein
MSVLTLFPKLKPTHLARTLAPIHHLYNPPVKKLLLVGFLGTRALLAS